MKCESLQWVMMTRIFTSLEEQVQNILNSLFSQKEQPKHELVENYRSKSNLVEFTNQFVKSIRND